MSNEESYGMHNIGYATVVPYDSVVLSRSDYRRDRQESFATGIFIGVAVTISILYFYRWWKNMVNSKSGCGGCGGCEGCDEH